MAAAFQPYGVRPWVLWDRRDPLRAAHGRADLDAVIVETPYERVRYDAYLQRLQNYALTARDVERWQREASGHFGFVVYAHSRDGDEHDDRKFLARFSPATVSVRGDGTLGPARGVVFGPSADFYDVGMFREQRYTGSITYRFAEPPGDCRPAGTLRFRDAYARPYAFPFDLAKFR